MFIKNPTLTLLSLLILCGLCLPLQAHTDYQEIQVKSTFQVNQRHQLHAITMVWLYDTFASEDMLSHEKDINRLAKILISDLARFNYLSSFNAGDRRLVTNKVSNYKLIKAKDRDNNPALQLTFTLGLKKPVEIKSLRDIKIVHADPTGKSVFFYDNANDISLSNKPKQRCRSRLIEKAEFEQGEFPQIATIICRS